MIGGLGYYIYYYIYKGKRGEVNVTNNDAVPPQQPSKANKFEME